MAQKELSLEELQSLFRDIQQESSAHKLSERNCVEVIMKLIDLKLLQVIFTLNGREYVTPKQLEREIQDEVFQHKGRVNIVELQPILNVDINHIQKAVDDIVRKDKQLQLVDGELIGSYYLDGMCEEINEALQEAGELTVGELAERFSLSAEFTMQVINRRLGKLIKGQLEGDTLYTNAYVARHYAQIRGVFSAITKPTSISSIVSNYGFQEGIFYDALDKLISEGRLNGTIQGKREKATFVPAVFAHARQTWIEAFFAQNGYIDYRTLERLQFTHPRSLLESKYPKGLALQTCFVNHTIVDQVDATAAETIATNHWVDVRQLVPSPLSNADIFNILQACNKSIKQTGKGANAVVLLDSYVASRGFLDRCVQLYQQDIKERIEKGLIQKLEPKQPPAKSEKEDTFDDEDSGRGRKGKGGKTGSRRARKEESSADSTSKGKGKKGKAETIETESSAEEGAILSLLQKAFEDAPQEFLEAVISHLRSTMSQIKEEATRAIFVGQQNKDQSTNLQEDFNTLYYNIQLFHKGIQTVDDTDAVLVLEKHLLKTLCNDVVNLLVTIQAKHLCIQTGPIKTPQERSAVMSQFPTALSSGLQKLVNTINGKSVNDFMQEMQGIAEKLEIQLKPLDKKREKQLLYVHRQAFMEQLAQEKIATTAFHLVLVTLYLKKFSAILHAPGRSLSVMLNKLKTVVPPELFTQLTEFQARAVKYLTTTDQQQLGEWESWMNAHLDQLKACVLGKEDEKEQEKK